MRIYADHNATSPLLPVVAEKLARAWGTPFANPSATYARARETREAIEQARASVSRLLGGGTVVFTGSATEANAAALWGHAMAAKREGNTRVVVSAIEHPSVLENAKRLRELGFTVDVGGSPDGAGVYSLMWANNETGLVQDIAQAAALCQKSGTRFHVDAVQAAGKLGPLVVPAGVDTISASAHKLGGLTGVGALALFGRKPDTWMVGGGHEGGMRGGTENVHGIFAFGWAAEEWLQHGDVFRAAMRAARDAYEASLTCVHRVLSGDRIANTSDVLLAGVRAEALLTALDLDGIAASHGAACATGALEPSRALLAMGLSEAEARTALRVSFGPFATVAEGNQVATVVSAVAKRLGNG